MEDQQNGSLLEGPVGCIDHHMCKVLKTSNKQATARIETTMTVSGQYFHQKVERWNKQGFNDQSLGNTGNQ